MVLENHELIAKALRTYANLQESKAEYTGGPMHDRLKQEAAACRTIAFLYDPPPKTHFDNFYEGTREETSDQLWSN